MTTTMDTPHPAATLDALVRESGKHASYQCVHPMLAPLLSRHDDLPAGKLEPQRQRFLEATLAWRGARVLDIGANTGYFSFAALAAGAARVTSFEGHRPHAEFMRVAAQRLGLAPRLQVRPRYFDFDADAHERYDIGLCLNVLHHLGDDFGERRLDIAAARERMRHCLDALAGCTATLVLQIGFNWKGDRHLPLFAGGEKAALIDYVREATRAAWHIDQIAVADPASREYVPLAAENLARNDAVGEFMNRPVFVLRSRRLGAD